MNLWGECGKAGEGQWIPQRQTLSSLRGSGGCLGGRCGGECGERDKGLLRAWDGSGQQLHTDAVRTYLGEMLCCSLMPIYLQPPGRLRACFSILCADQTRLNSMTGF